MRNEEMCSASPTLSKPLEDVSSGSVSRRSTWMPSRSQMVRSYSTRLSRRRTVRPAGGNLSSAISDDAAKREKTTIVRRRVSFMEEKRQGGEGWIHLTVL